jgi:hypothetical protein
MVWDSYHRSPFFSAEEPGHAHRDHGLPEGTLELTITQVVKNKQEKADLNSKNQRSKAKLKRKQLTEYFQ